VNDIAPGWYKDPAEPTTQRYWDGEGWLGDPLPVDATPPSGPPPVKAPPAPAAVTLPLVAPEPVAPAPPPPPAPPHGPAWPPSPGAGWPHGAPPPAVPPGMPPGTIPWPQGVPVPPGYRLAHPLAHAAPRPHGLPVAPLGRRLVARLIDVGIVLALNVLATGWLVYLFLRDYIPLVRALTNRTGDALPPVPGRMTVLAYLIPFVAMLVWLAYEVPAIASTGQTLGKRALGIKVMALESMAPLGFGRALRRWGVLGWPMIFWFCGLGFVLQFVDALSPTWGGPLQLALHDRSAQTVVVHCGRRGRETTPVKAPGKAGEL
jgi:uncharacterized RDD family membrane protein YckC